MVMEVGGGGGKVGGKGVVDQRIHDMEKNEHQNVVGVLEHRKYSGNFSLNIFFKFYFLNVLTETHTEVLCTKET